MQRTGVLGREQSPTATVATIEEAAGLARVSPEFLTQRLADYSALNSNGVVVQGYGGVRFAVKSHRWGDGTHTYTVREAAPRHANFTNKAVTGRSSAAAPNTASAPKSAKHEFYWCNSTRHNPEAYFKRPADHDEHYSSPAEVSSLVGISEDDLNTEWRRLSPGIFDRCVPIVTLNVTQNRVTNYVIAFDQRTHSYRVRGWEASP